MERKPNILWIQTDELRADALGCYGHPRWPAGSTPNLDGLAARGVRFTSTYCNSPVCVPSRTSVLAGRYPHETGTWHNDGVFPNVTVDPGEGLEIGHPSFPEVLARAGYRTVSMGKTHTALPGVWQETVEEPEPYGGYHDFDCHGDARKDPEAVNGMVVLPGPPHVVLAGDYPSEPTPTTTLTDVAVRWLGEKGPDAEQPWLLRVSYLMPHSPVMPPRRFAEMFDPEDFAFDRALDTADEDMAPFERYVSDVQRGSELTEEDIARARANYWAVVAHLDEEVGRVLRALAEAGLADDTIVVFDTDHGTMLGELGLWQKHIFSDPAHRVPLLMSWPGRLPQGEVRQDLNELVDRGRTLLGLCRLEAPAQMRGRNIFGDAPAPEYVGSVLGSGESGTFLYALPRVGPDVPRRYCIRTQEWRYETAVRAAGRDLAEEDPARQPALFHLPSDPQERKNLIGDESVAEVESRMRAYLAQWAEMTQQEPTSV